MEDNRILKKWLILIKDSKNQTVKILASHAEKNEKLNLKTFFKRIFAKRKSVKVPKTWEWNGTDAKGNKLPDGVYTYQAIGWDRKKNKGYSKKGTIIIKTTPPKANLKINLTLFSPNNDGNKDFTTIEQKVTGKDTDWNGIIINNKGKIVKKWNWKTKPPKKNKWDGKNNNGKTVKDGNYTYILEGIDKAGNKIRKKITNITVTTRIHPVDVRADKDAFSPNNDNKLDTVNFTPQIEDKKYFENWTLAIKDNNKTIRKFDGYNTIPNSIPWDGKKANGEIVKDGIYKYFIKARYKDGDNPKSYPKKIIVDTTPPKISLSQTPKLFSPDDDGENDQCKFFVSIKDISPIKNWKLTITHNGRIFKTFKGRDPKKSNFIILWNGKGDKGEIVESATIYKAEMEATDKLENKGKSNKIDIKIDILIIKTARGLKIRISNIEFAYAKWELKTRNSPILNRVAEILKKYSEYKVIIEGHSDNHGTVNYNLMLSTRRARTVMKYLIRKGIIEDRMLSKGLGLSMPIASNYTSWGRAKNRRVEFILVKDD